MLSKSTFNKINYPILLLTILPISIVLGSSISLVNTILIGLIFLPEFMKSKKLFFYDQKALIAIAILYVYLIFNTIISIDYFSGIFRNVGFIRFILFFISINFIIFKFGNSEHLLKIWALVFFIVIIDIYIERLTGSNLLGFGKTHIDGVAQPHGERVVSFFKTEPIAGAFATGFIFITLGYLVENFKKRNNFRIYILLIILFCSIGILITGERSNLIKVVFGIFLFFLLTNFLNWRLKIISFFIIFLMLGTAINFSDYLKTRYIGQLFKQIKTLENRKKFTEESLYFKLYRSGLSVFKNYQVFGVGNKNYRVETCDKKKINLNKDYYCTTHPHQIYIEFLSEHGIFGTVIILSIIFYLMFRILKVIIRSQNYVQIGAFIFILINFIPLLPSGSFFSDFNLTLFMTNFSLMYAINKNTNIFRLKKL